jgi:pimeloyl-ACP methyl ester carboxylesterase
MPSLRQRFRVLNVDLGGFGRAPKPRGTAYGPVAQADALVAWIDRLDLRDLTLVGHSLGGAIALLVALRLLDQGEGRLAGLASVAGAAYHTRPEPPFVRFARRPLLSRLALEFVPRRWLIRTAMRRVVVQRSAVTPDRVASYAAPLATRAGRAALVSCARDIIPPDLERITARYADITVPVLCLWGRQDPVVPLRVGRRLAEVLPDARLEVLEACGHLPVEERPRESLAAFDRFFAERVQSRLSPAPRPRRSPPTT